MPAFRLHPELATPQQLADGRDRQKTLWNWTNVLSSKNFYNANSVYEHLSVQPEHWILCSKTTGGGYAEKWAMAICKHCTLAVVADLRCSKLEESEEKIDAFFGLTTVARQVRRRCIYETMKPNSCVLLHTTS